MMGSRRRTEVGGFGSKAKYGVEPETRLVRVAPDASMASGTYAGPSSGIYVALPKRPRSPGAIRRALA